MGPVSESDAGSPGALIASRVRVLTWNIWWRYGPWEQRQPAIEKTLQNVNADIIALQEVWDDGRENLAKLIADKLGYSYVYAAYDERKKGVRFGNAILSRWPITSEDSRKLPAPPDAEEHRCVLHGAVDGPRGPLDVFSTHLNWKAHHSHVRQMQVQAVAEFIAERAKNDCPPILCGDFNANPDSEEIRVLTGQTTCAVEGLVFLDAWRVAGGRGEGLTWDNKNPYAVLELEPNRRIDYVLVGYPGQSGAGLACHAEVTGDEPVDGVWPSDHHAVLVELRY